MVRSSPGTGATTAFAAAVLLALALAACGSDQVDDPAQDDAEIYRTVIGDLVARSGVTFPQSDDPPVLYVEALGVDGIDLEIQVELVTAWVERYDIRFIDDRGEAVDPDIEGFPVREGSLLLGLGPITRDGTAEVRGETYLFRGRRPCLPLRPQTSGFEVDHHRRPRGDRTRGSGRHTMTVTSPDRSLIGDSAASSLLPVQAFHSSARVFSPSHWWGHCSSTSPSTLLAHGFSSTWR